MLNRFPGSCGRCGQHIPAQAGEARLTPGGWQTFCVPECEPRPSHVRSPAIEQTVGDLTGILALFDRAKGHLKYPTIEIGVPAIDPGYAIRLNVAGPKAASPGSLTVVTAEKDPTTGRRAWLGRVTRDGYFQAGGDARTSGRLLGAVLGRLRAFAADPARVAAEHGKLTGRCCFCRMPLSDERSTAVGYGKTCSEHFGVYWGAKPAEFAGEPMRRVS